MWHWLQDPAENAFGSAWHPSLRQSGAAQDNPSVWSMYPLPLQLANHSPEQRVKKLTAVKKKSQKKLKAIFQHFGKYAYLFACVFF